jgi:uracil-DNA glycosylase
MDKDLIDSVIIILHTYFNIDIESREVKKRKTPTWRLFFYSKQLVELLEFIGYNFEICDKKQIPLCILQSPLSVQKAVLQGLYDTDGGVSPSTINFTTTSPIMGKQIQEILLNNGILCSRHVMCNEILSLNYKKVYRLNVTGKDARLFVKEVGFKCYRKKQISECKYLSIDISEQKDNKSQAFPIPNSFQLISSLRIEMRNGKKRIQSSKITLLGNKLLSSLIRKQYLRYRTIQQLITNINNIEQYTTGKFLKFLNDNGLVVDKVSSIEYLEKIQMYDIGVSPIKNNYLPDGHDFIAGGFVNHNSQGSSVDSALVDVGSSTFEFGQAYVALSRVRSLAGLYVWKLDPRKIRCHPSVKSFYTTLTQQQTESSQYPNNDGSDDPSGPPNPMPWTLQGLAPAWRTVVEPFLASPAGQRLHEQLTARLSYQTFAPAPDDVFASLRACPDPAAIKVIILGQDPYPTAGHAHGLAFSVRPSVAKLPPSLVNMYKELVVDLGLKEAPATGSLIGWATQGVLLLNTTLTVAVGTPMSHAGLGWEELTAQLLATVLAAAPHVVIVAWGKHAQDRFKVAAVRPFMGKHTLLAAPHPSPLSAHTGFFGSRPYSQTNAALKAHGQTEILWA